MDDPSRRGVLAIGAAGALLAATSARSKPAVIDGPAAWLRAFMLMRGALDERLVIGFISGRYHGVVGDETTPLYGVIGATFARYRRRPDGRYDGITRELPFFTDLATGKVIDTFRNPYTGEDVAVVHGGYPASRLIIGDDLKVAVAELPPGMTLDNGVIARDIVGDDVWIVEQSRSAFQPKGTPAPVRYSEIVTLHARLADLARREATRVPAQTVYTSIVSWRPWLKMGARPGHLIGTGHGGYGVALADLPRAWHERVAATQPAVLSDPGSLLPAW